MKKNLLFIGMFLLCQTFAHAQGLVFEKLSFNQALEKAEEENKALFIDFSTVWCGPCHKMDQEVFPEESVGNFYNANFVNLKFDGEKGEGVELVKKFGIEGYPTFLFVTANGDILYRFEGFREPEALLSEAFNVKIAAKYGGWEKFKEEYKKGRSDAGFLWDYYSISGKQPDILLKYLKALSDDELIDVKNAPFFNPDNKPHIAYDYDLYARIVKKLVAKKDSNPDYRFSYVFPIQWNFSQSFTKVIKEQNDSVFAQLMELKKTFAPLCEGQDTDIYLPWGRGYVFASDDYIRLSYDASNQINFEAFKPRMEAYMDRLMTEHPTDSVAAKANLLLQDKNSPFFIFALSDVVEMTEYTAEHILMWTDYYWRNLPTTPQLKARCEEWAQYAFDINSYNPKTAVSAAQLLARFGEKQRAVACIEKTIALRKNVIPNDEQNIRKLQITLRDIKNDK